MDTPLHKEFFERKSLKLVIKEALEATPILPNQNTIKNIMAYSKALSVSQYESLGQQEMNLN